MVTKGKGSEMKAKIDRLGSLWIERAGKMVAQCCPINDASCGDDCPHFGEVKQSVEMKSGSFLDSTQTVSADVTASVEGDIATVVIKTTAKPFQTLSLCHGTVITGEIVDERVTT